MPTVLFASNVVNAPDTVFPGTESIVADPNDPNQHGFIYGMGVHVNNKLNSGITITGDFRPENQKDIMLTMGILLNGEYRENTLTSGIYNYIEKYTRTPGSAKEGLYCYNFCLNTSPFEYQPSGAINLSKFKNIDLELTTVVPPVDAVSSVFDVICGTDGTPLGYKKSNWRLYDYNYNLTLYEERYNVLSFIGGNCGMLYTR